MRRQTLAITGKQGDKVVCQGVVMNYTNTDCRIKAAASTFARIFRRKPVRKGARAMKAAGVVRTLAKATVLFALTAVASAEVVIRPLTELLSKETKIYNHVP